MIRVTRVLEYVYADQAAFEEDQARWFLGVSRVARPNNSVTIRSAMLPPEYITVGGPPAFGIPTEVQIDEATDYKLTDTEKRQVAELFGYNQGMPKA